MPKQDTLAFLALVKVTKTKLFMIKILIESIVYQDFAAFDINDSKHTYTTEE